MNIAFTYPSPFNPTLGGVERVTDVLCREFQQRGHKVFYFHHRNAELYSDYVPPAKAVFAVSEDFTSAVAVESYHRFLRENNIEVVINQCGLFSDSTLYTNVHVDGMAAPKVISVMHSDPMLNYRRLYTEVFPLRNNSFKEHFKRIARCILYPRIKRRYLHERVSSAKFAITHSDAVVLLSDGYRKSFQKLCGDDYKAERVYAIPNPLPPNSDKAPSAPRRPWLLYVGRLSHGEKRPDRLIKIWARLYKQFPEWELHIVGDGPCRAKLEKMARKLPRIFFEGWQNPTAYYQQAKILLMTSNFEGFPMVLPEAMSYGCVPVVFNSFAVASEIIVDNQDGVLVSPYNITAYAKRASELMKCAELWEKMSIDARAVSSIYDVERVLTQWAMLI